MDATQVLANLNNTWTGLLDKYYDHIAEEYLQWMSVEFNIPLETLKEKAAPIKDQVLASAAHKIENPESSIKKKKQTVAHMKQEAKNTEKQNVIDSDPSNKYSYMGRKELVELCKARRIPVKRKNQDMMDASKAGDPSGSRPPLDQHEPEPEHGHVAADELQKEDI